MATNHPETEIVPYLRGELSADEHARVGAHLEGCAQCRETADASSAMLSNLAEQSMTSAIRIGRTYRAELKRKLRASQATARAFAGAGDGGERIFDCRSGFGWPSMALGAAAVAVLAIAIVMHRGAGSSTAPGVDQLELQQELSSADVGLLANYHVVEHLDLLENYDVIEHLDELGPGDRQNNETPS